MIGAIRRQLSHVRDRRCESPDVAGESLVSCQEPDRLDLIAPAAARWRTLAIEQRSSEVWQVLGAVKTEFRKFGEVLSKTRSQLEAVTRSIESAETRTRQMSKKLRDVEALPGEQAANLLGDERDEREDRDEPET